MANSPEMRPAEEEIRIGPEYQAVVPKGLCRYDDAMPYDNKDKLLWDPGDNNESLVEEFLLSAGEQGLASSLCENPGGHVCDDERALFYLLKSGYNPDEALRRLKMSTASLLNQQEPFSGHPFLSEEECQKFEEGLATYGKDFRLIQLSKVHTRSIGELVHFYYHWKKSERYDVFAHLTRLVDIKKKRTEYNKNYKRKEKYPINQNVTDYMAGYLEENVQKITDSTIKLHLANIDKSHDKLTNHSSKDGKVIE